MDRSKGPRYPRTHLFMVRLWRETFDNGQREVRIQVQHVLSGERRYFRQWSLLVAYLLAKLQEVETAAQQEEIDNQ